MSERNEFNCAARGCDGCIICVPEQQHKHEGVVIMPATKEALIDLLDTAIAVGNKLAVENARLREVLQLIATPKRPDGTYNRSREACEQLAREALEGK